MAESKFNDVEISCRGIDYMINNDWESCEKLFNTHKEQSPLMHYCCSFMTFMRAIMSFEEQMLEQAAKDFDTTEKLCSNQTKVLSSLKKAFSFSKSSNSSSTQSLQQQFANANSFEDKIMKQVIIADCKLFKAILTFISQDVSGYLSNGLLQIRSSWKIYSRLQKQLFDLFKKLDPKAEQIYGTSDINSSSIKFEDDKEDKDDDATIQNALNDISIATEGETNIETVKRLLGAVSFGFGLFQLAISFIPPNILRLIKIFGFESDRTEAIKAIIFTSNSKDMCAPLADMTLLWYETMAKPLFGLTEADISIGAKETEQILNKNLQKYPRSSLFLYFKGKYYRSILKDLKGAEDCFKSSVECATQIREMQLIGVYELGWLYLMELDYENALKCFTRLSQESRWSHSYHYYVCALLHGCLGNNTNANEAIKKGLASVKQKSNPIEIFSLRRLEYFRKNQIKTSNICEFMCVELNYLWVCIPYCEKKPLEKMLEICDKQDDKNLYAMKCLFEGLIHKELGNIEFSQQCFEETLARSENEKQSGLTKYILPSVYYQLGVLKINSKSYDEAKQLLNKAKDNYKEYDFENRIVAQIRSAIKNLKHLTNNNNNESSNNNSKTESELQVEKEKEEAVKNFYL